MLIKKFRMSTLAAAAAVLLAPMAANAAITLGTTAHGHSVTGAPRESLINASPAPRIETTSTFMGESLLYPGQTVASSAIAYGDLTTGKIGAKTLSSWSGYSNAFAAWSEGVTIINPNVGVNDVWDLHLTVHLHGEMSLLPGFGGYGYADSTFDLMVGGQSYLGFQQTSQFRAFRQLSSAQGLVAHNTPVMWADFETIGGPLDTTVFLTRRVVGNNFLLPISMSQQVRTIGNASADFLNTATFRFDLPAGATFTSRSGHFLTDVGTVPEPATWAVMILGFGLAGASLRRRRAIRASGVSR